MKKKDETDNYFVTQLLKEIDRRFKRKKVGKKERLKSKAWKCSNCGAVFIGKEKVENPAPCMICKGKIFETVPVGIRLFLISLCDN